MTEFMKQGRATLHHQNKVDQRMCKPINKSFAKWQAAAMCSANSAHSANQSSNSANSANYARSANSANCV